MAACKPKTFDQWLKGGKLPEHIVPIINPDKDGLDTSWTKGRRKLDFPIFRAVLAGNPGSGKSNWIKDHIIRRARWKRPFKKIYVVVGSARTREWTRFSHNIKVVASEELPPEGKLAKPDRLLILDDVDIKGLSKEDQELLPRLFKHFSSHFGLSIAVTAQNFTEVPITIRRACNLFIIYRTPDMAAAGKAIADRVGIPADKAKRMLGLLKDTHDHLVVDLIPNSPMPHRFNSIKKIKFKGE